MASDDMMALTQLMELLGKDLNFVEPNLEKAHEKGICVACGIDAQSRCKTDAGRKEYLLSGLCEICFDSIFADDA